MAKSLLRMAVIVLVAIGVGAVTSHLRGLPWFPPKYNGAKPAPTLTAAEVVALAPHALVIDARDAEYFEEARFACPYIVNIRPDNAIDVAYELAPLTAMPDARFILYCTEPSCPDSKHVRQRIIDALGAMSPDLEERMYLYPEGWEGVEQHKLDVNYDPPANFFDVLNEYLTYVSELMFAGDEFDSAAQAQE